MIDMKYGRKDATTPQCCVDEGNLPAGNAPFPDADTPQVCRGLAKYIEVSCIICGDAWNGARPAFDVCSVALLVMSGFVTRTRCMYFRYIAFAGRHHFFRGRVVDVYADAVSVDAWRR